MSGYVDFKAHVIRTFSRSVDGAEMWYRGEGDRICFVTGDSGSFIGYCGAVYTRPELQPDGSLLFWQIELTIESEDFAGWAEDKTYTPDTARAVPVRLVPTDAGWRVAEVSALG